MTLNDLRDEISALGFEREIDIDKNLIFAVRRALATVYTERSVHNAFFVEHHPIMPTLVCKFFTHSPENTESFTLKGKAYSFAVSGTGFFSVEEDGARTEHSFSSPLYIWKGFIKNEATVRFFGEYAFDVFNVALFDALKSDSEDDLFYYGSPFEYNLSELRRDFHSFTSLPTDEHGQKIKGALLQGDKLIIPWGYRGKINLTYKVKAPEVSMNFAESEIGIAREVEHLIPLLSAAYYWADDAPDKAEYYLALYKDAMRSAKQFDTRNLGGGYDDVTGWA